MLLARICTAQEHVCAGGCPPKKVSAAGVLTLVSPSKDSIRQGEDVYIEWTSLQKFDKVYIGYSFGPHNGKWIEEHSFEDTG